jgi:hypothetical protein
MEVPMPRSPWSHDAPLADDACAALVDDLLVAGAALDAAKAALRRAVTAYVTRVDDVPGPADAALATQVVDRLEADDGLVLREWRRRQAAREDQAPFWTMVRTVTWYLAVQRSLAPRAPSRVSRVTARAARRPDR